MSEPQTLNLASHFTIFYDIMIDDRTGRNITSTYGDRTLRKLAALHIVQDVRRMNMKHRNESKNRALQNIMFQLLQVLYGNVFRPAIFFY